MTEEYSGRGKEQRNYGSRRKFLGDCGKFTAGLALLVTGIGIKEVGADPRALPSEETSQNRTAEEKVTQLAKSIVENQNYKGKKAEFNGQTVYVSSTINPNQSRSYFADGEYACTLDPTADWKLISKDKDVLDRLMFNQWNRKYVDEDWASACSGTGELQYRECGIQDQEKFMCYTLADQDVEDLELKDPDSARGSSMPKSSPQKSAPAKTKSRSKGGRTSKSKDSGQAGRGGSPGKN